MMMESNRYQDREVRKVIDKKLLNKIIFRSLFLQASFNYERMQAAGWLYSILPGLKAIHKDPEDLKKSMKLHLELFNSHPFLINFIQGIVLAMEENKEDIDTIRGIKIATMGPLGGIGDSIFWLTLVPIATGIGAQMAINGQVFGPILYVLFLVSAQLIIRYVLMHYGYRTGVSAISSLKENTKKVSRAATIVGVTVVGSLAASMVNLSIKTEIVAGASTVKLQEGVLDKVMPKLLPISYTFLILYLIKKKVSPIYLVLITLVVGVLGAYLGIL